MAETPQTETLTLRRSVQVRRKDGSTSPSYGPGTVKVPIEDARILRGQVSGEPPEAATTGPQGGEVPATRPQGSPIQQNGPSEPANPFKGMTKAELEAEVALRPNMPPITRADGKEGEPLHSDLVAALVAYEAAKAGSVPPPPPEA